MDELMHNLIALNTPASPGAAEADMFTLSRPDALAGTGAGAIKVDREAGVIRNVSIISIGPALGHGFQITKNTLDSVLRCAAANDNVKVRLTHPDGNFFGGKDPIEVTVGEPRNLRIDGDCIRADIHLFKFASKMPALGDVRSWLMDVAEEAPRKIGMSIVAKLPRRPVTDPATGATLHMEAICEFLHAADFVGDPAANRNGLLSAAAGNGGDHSSRMEKDMKLNKAQIAFLQSKGLAKGADEAAIAAFVAKLSGADKTKLEELKATADPAPADAATPANSAQQTAQTPAQQLAQPAQPPAAGPAQLSAEQLQQIQLGERNRITQIRNLGRDLQLSDAMLTQAIDGNQPFDQFRVAALEQFARDNAPVAGLSTRVSVGSDGRDTLAIGCEDALYLSYDGELAEGQQPHERHREFMGRSILGVARQFLTGLGVSTVAMSDIEVAQTVLSRGRLSRHLGVTALMHSTSDFPNILANTLRKRMARSYTETESTWEAWANRELVDDFKTVTANVLGHVPTPPKVVEGAEYTLATVGAKRETYAVAKYGFRIFFTWEMLINDDLRAFTRQALGFDAASKRLENDLIYAQLTGNQVMTEDSKAVFHSDHNNLSVGGAAALAITPLDKMRGAMRTQKGIAPDAATTGPTLAIRMGTLLVPDALVTVAEQLVASTVKPGGTNNEPNYKFVRSLNVVSEPRLDDDSATAYYGVAPKNGPVETGVVVFLRGHAAPFIEELDAGSAVDGRGYKLRHVAGARLMDYRGFQKQAGA